MHHDRAGPHRAAGPAVLELRWCGSRSRDVEVSHKASYIFVNVAVNVTPAGQEQ